MDTPQSSVPNEDTVILSRIRKDLTTLKQHEVIINQEARSTARPLPADEKILHIEKEISFNIRPAHETTMSSKETETDSQGGTRTIAIQTRHTGSWCTKKRLGWLRQTHKWNPPPKRSKPSKGRGTQTPRTRCRNQFTQTRGRPSSHQPGTKQQPVPTTNLFHLKEITDDNIRNFMPGTPTKS
ncbi:hypothetical protein KPH14_000908 [Odynerus spinipes]|uniref:Uncharacterized protein n=1 Tax=Odynerus spinipes TaxID=1348599 RepID=A0AAD9VK04_9HYME|nr:hypothetical protein KPH14_000908 [Odynerus spinipes]